MKDAAKPATPPSARCSFASHWSSACVDTNVASMAYKVFSTRPPREVEGVRLDAGGIVRESELLQRAEEVDGGAVRPEAQVTCHSPFFAQ